jgi:hypothetical protein
MSYILTKENQYTATGDFIILGQKQATNDRNSNFGYVVSDHNIFYKINKTGTNYPYAEYNIDYTPYDTKNNKNKSNDEDYLTMASLNNIRIAETPSKDDLLKKYAVDYSLLNNLEGNKNYCQVKK